MARKIANKDQAASQSDTGVKRRGLLRFGTLVTAITGASAISAIGANSAQAAPIDKTSPNTYVPIAEKGAPSGVASLDVNAKILPTQLPDLSATYARADTLSVQALGATLDGTTDDTAIIQAALDTGKDVVIAGAGNATAYAKTTATLVLKKAGQQLITKNAAIQPAFIGDAVLITYQAQRVDCVFSGAAQPNTGNAFDYQEVAAIRIGGGLYNPKNASVAGSRIPDPWKGNGIIWEQGAHINFTQFSIESSATYDGIRCTRNYDDNNEGYFADTRVSNCGRYGYWLQWSTTHELSSRTHLFLNAKAFNCSRNFLFETDACNGMIFSENGKNPDRFTATSAANAIQYEATNAMYSSVEDLGVGNRLSGLNAFGKWDTRIDLVQALDINALKAGRLRMTQSADYVFDDTILDTNNNVTVNHGHGGTGVRTDNFAGPVNANGGLNVAGGAVGAALGLSVSGMVRYNNSVRSASVSIPSNGSSMNFADASTGAITLTLPTTGVSNGTVYTFIKTDATANAVVLAGSINGTRNYTLTTQFKFVQLIASGSNSWYIIGGN